MMNCPNVYIGVVAQYCSVNGKRGDETLFSDKGQVVWGTEKTFTPNSIGVENRQIQKY